MTSKCFYSQLNNRTRRDWVTTVIDDLKYLGMENASWDTLKNMKKGSYMRQIKEKISMKTLEKFNDEKKSHSKVREIEHNSIKMQKYLQPNSMKICKEDAQLIFQLRCRMTEAKINLKGMYDNLECGACSLEEESQQHIIQCSVINKNKEVKHLDYGKLFVGTVEEKLKIAQKFKENFAVLEGIKKKVDN